MKYNCDLISDLLPLYKDEICSEASRKIIEEHLAECPDCKKMLNSLNDVTIDEKIVKEKEEVIGTQAKFFKRKSALAGSIIGLIFSIPISQQVQALHGSLSYSRESWSLHQL